MKNSLIITALILGGSAYIYQYHTPAAGWSSIFSECKHCSCSHKRVMQEAPQEVLTVAVASDETASSCAVQQS